MGNNQNRGLGVRNDPLEKQIDKIKEKFNKKMEETQEMNMTNKVNIEFLRDQLDKALKDIEELKDKVRANGAH